MTGQLSIFDVMQSTMDVPSVNEEGYISSDLLVPIKWEHWKYADDKLTLNGGEPYVISAILAIFPGNRLYVKDWMLYPFMHELPTACEVSKTYHTIRKKIIERMTHDNEFQRTWKVDELPTFQDMWQYKDGEYSCKEYAEKMIHGYGV